MDKSHKFWDHINYQFYGRFGHGDASAGDRQGPWQGASPCSSLVLPSQGGTSAVLPASFVGAGTTPSRVCEQPGCMGDVTIIATNSSDTSPPGCGLDCDPLH